MTVTSTTRTAGPFTGNGGQTDFPFTMRVFTDTDIVAAQTDTTGAVTTLTLGSDYTVAINSDQRDNPGGTLTMLDPLAEDFLLDMTTSLEATQGARLTNAGGFYPEVVENALDKLTILHQQSTTNKAQVLRFPFPETVDEFPSPADRANKIVAFNSSGGLSLLAPTSGDATDLALTLSGSGGSDEIGFIQSGTGADVRTVQDKLRESVSVKDFGAVGDGTTDDTAAFAAAYSYALGFFGASSLSAATIYFPPGAYLITSNNFLGSLDFTALTGGYDTRIGLTIEGAGWGTSILWRPTSSSSDCWMYDQGTSGTPENILIYLAFKDITVTHDVVNLSGGAKANGFRLRGTSGSNGVVQGFQFLHARFSILDYGNGVSTAKRAKCGTFMKIAGTVNASEMTWSDSLIQAYTTVLDIGANAEAVNHNFNNTSAELIFGDVFKVGGGHSVNVRGGSWIMESEATSYFLAIRQGASGLSGGFYFEGGRTELRINSLGTYLSNWLLTDATGYSSTYQSSFPVIKFAGWTSKISGASARDTFVIDAAFPAKISIDGCSIGDIGATQYHKVSVNSSKSGLQTANTQWWMAELDFVNGDAVAFDNVSFTDANSTARISARNCRNCIDYDLTANGISDQVVGRVRPLKTATFWGTSWPDTGNNATMQIRLPKGALLKKVMFRKAANAGTATAGYQLAAIDGASNQYCASTSANQNVEHKASADDLNIYMDDDLGYSSGISASQVVFIVALAGHLGSAQAVAMATTDYALVEYY